jgi:hypothetical protein
MNEIIFLWYLITGTIVFQKDVDGRDTYRINFDELTVITEGDKKFIGYTVDYAYKEEILEYIDSGDFEYNEDL